MSTNRGGGDWVSLSLGVMLVLGTIVGGSFLAWLIVPNSSQFEIAVIVLYLVLGPLSTLLAAIVMFWNRRVGAFWLIGGGLGSFVVGACCLYIDRGVVLPFLVSAPMVVCGIRVLRPPRADEELIALSRPEPGPLLPSRADEEGKVYQRTRSPVLSMFMFVGSFVVAFFAVGIPFVWAGETGLLGNSVGPWGSPGRHEALVCNSIAIVATVLAALCHRASKWTRIPLPAILGLATGMLGVCFLFWSM